MKKYDVVAIVGSYTDRNGQEKLKYKNVGMVNESDKGLSIMIDTPVVIDDEGKVVKWFKLYEPKPKTQNAASGGDLSDGIPFRQLTNEYCF